MRLERVVLVGAQAVSALTLLHACSSSDGGGGKGAPFVPDAGTTDVVPDDVVVREAAAAPRGYDGGVGLGLADVDDTPCATRGGALATILPAVDGSTAPSFRNLHVVGGRRVADATDGSAFLSFDADGANAKVVTPSLANAATATLGAQILAGGAAPGFIGASAQTYDGNGDAVGAPIGLTTAVEDPEGLAVGADDAEALFVWTHNLANKVRARGVANGVAVGAAPYDLALGAYVDSPSIAVAPVQPNLFAVAFSGFDSGDRWMTGFGRASTTDRVGDPTILFTGPVERTVAGLARTSNGLALLVTVADGAAPYAMLMTLDVGGHRTSAGLKLLGTSAAAAVASSADGHEIGVLATRRDAAGIAVEFRPFGLDGAPLGPWVCLDAAGSSADVGGGLAADGAGWSAIFRAKDGTTSLARFDHLGTGAP